MPIINNFKIYAYLGLIALAVFFYIRYDYLSNRVKEQDHVIEKYSAAYEKVNQQIRAAEQARTQYLNQLEASKNEINTLRNRVGSGATGLRVKATCPKLPATSTDSPGTETAAPELAADARSTYFALREGIALTEAKYSLCLKTLEDERK